jgi:hypothetical protein
MSFQTPHIQSTNNKKYCLKVMSTKNLAFNWFGYLALKK